jgi:threonine dehydrogenase-like Zn-dependent dehydrogenase
MFAEPFKVTVEERPLPTLKHPGDALIKVTTATICGSDLHMYQGRTVAQGGPYFGMTLLQWLYKLHLMTSRP